MQLIESLILYKCLLLYKKSSVEFFKKWLFDTDVSPDLTQAKKIVISVGLVRVIFSG